MNLSAQIGWILPVVFALLLSACGSGSSDSTSPTGAGSETSIDSDNDGFSDAQEVAAGSNPADSISVPNDIDGDGFSNDDETAAGSDPANRASVPNDIDADGFSNDDETAAGSDPANRASVPSDIDGDGFSNDDETAAGSDPANRASVPNDIDADGFSNDDETAAGSDPADRASVPSDIDGDGFSNDDETAAGSDPANRASVPSDIDGDGFSNDDETAAGSDPANRSSIPSDIDADGFSNDDETAAGSDPANRASVPSDIDADGFSNDDETAAGSDPANNASVPSDIDADGFSNDDETAAGSDPANNASVPSDIDGDGFSNDDETAAGSDPANRSSVPSDIDGDGFSNDDETAAGSDPANRASVPSDIDGDGFSNDDETAAGSDPANRSSIPSDIDADGFSNDDETAAGSDPANSASVPSDIDGDGFSNDDETAAGSDPANNASVPSDIDGDGIANVDDVFPTDPTRSNLDAPEMTLTFHATKLFRFDWTDVEAATYYRLLENPDGLSGFTQVGQNIAAGVESMTLEVPLYARPNGEYILQACNDISCTDSATLFVESTMVEAIGYVKASNPDANDNFGTVVSLSSDGSTLVVGTPTESSDAVGVDGDQNNNAAGRSGAVYVFNKTAAGQWSQQAYLKASNTGSNDRFGFALHLSRDGNTLAVGAPFESSDSTGVNGDQSNNNKQNSGAVYIFVRDISGNWSQQAYIKATHPTKNAQFARTLTLSADGNTLAAGAMLESSNATGIDGDETNTSASTSGAVYIFTRNTDTWNQQAYVKASNTGENDLFGSSVSLNQDGSTLVVGATREDSSASGINGDQSDNSAQDSGAVYVFVRDDTDRWSQQAYIKASTSETGDYFGSAVTLNDDGSILAVGAQNEDSSSGINGDETDNSAANSGATYIFIRDSTDQWSQEAYLKAQNARFKSNFGSSLSMNSEGNVLAIGAVLNKAGAPGVNGDVSANGYNDSGAVYTFIRDIGGQWNQQAVMRASNIENAQKFGSSISLNSDATVLAIGSRGENGGAKGINSDQSDDSLSKSGAVYLF